MPRKGENIRKRKDGRWEARYENPVTKMAGFSMAMYMLTLMIL